MRTSLKTKIMYPFLLITLTSLQKPLSFVPKVAVNKALSYNDIIIMSLFVIVFQTIKFSTLGNSFFNSYAKITCCLGTPAWLPLNMFYGRIVQFPLKYSCCIATVKAEQCMAGNYRAHICLKAG